MVSMIELFRRYQLACRECLVVLAHTEDLGDLVSVQRQSPNRITLEDSCDGENCEEGEKRKDGGRRGRPSDIFE